MFPSTEIFHIDKDGSSTFPYRGEKAVPQDILLDIAEFPFHQVEIGGILGKVTEHNVPQ